MGMIEWAKLHWFDFGAAMAVATIVQIFHSETSTVCIVDYIRR